jgi:hypothetical protein
VKEHETPWELIPEREPEVNTTVCALPPAYLDESFMKKLDAKLQCGYDVSCKNHEARLRRCVC